MHKQIRKFLSSNEPRMHVGPEETALERRFLFPGSFNPLHAGHRQMVEFANLYRDARPNVRWQEVQFEISVKNVDKPDLESAVVFERLQQFDLKSQSVWLTKAATFAEKAQLFPHSTFLVGADTVQRLFDVKYYASEVEVRHAIQLIKEQSCRFLAFGRLLGPEFCSGAVPPSAECLFDFVAESEFRCDVSSTQIRKRTEQ